MTANQFRPLLGERGLQPAPRFLAAVPFRRAPSIFHLHYSDRFLTVVAWTGAGLAAAALAGLPEAGPAWVSVAVWLAMWALYLSIVNVGQTFYGFGWETLLLEAGFLAIFLGPAATAPPTLVLWLYRWLLFRVEFGAGLIKLRGDRCWRDLSCLDYHHETQPLPGPLSWFFHHLPRPLHRAEVLANHATQLVVPFGLFAPQPIARTAALVIVVTQAWLLVSGNFSWLNLITIVLAVSAMDDALQEAYVRAFRALPRFRGDARMGTWLFRITYNACLDELARGRKVTHVTLDELVEQASGEPQPGEALAHRSEMAAALRALPADERAVVFLVDVHGYDYARAAELVGVPVGTVASRLSRARHSLRHALRRGSGSAAENPEAPE